MIKSIGIAIYGDYAIMQKLKSAFENRIRELLPFGKEDFKFYQEHSQLQTGRALFLDDGETLDFLFKLDYEVWDNANDVVDIFIILVEDAKTLANQYKQINVEYQEKHEYNSVNGSYIENRLIS